MRPRHLVALLLALVGGAADAHDTWFEPLPATAYGEVTLALGTGNRFPLYDQGVDVKYLAQSGCRVGAGAPRALSAVRYDDKRTVLRTRAVDAAALTCWVQLDPFEFELPPDRIPVYFKEIRPSAEVLAAWDALRARGLPFVERYTKSARIDGAEASPLPTGTLMDVLRVAPAGALAVGTEARFQVLREGRPLANFPVELINERSPIGLWQRTDAQGFVSARLPLPGRWVLRGTDLRLSTADPTRWESQFITYAFDVVR